MAEGMLSTGPITRRSLLDWLSVSRQTESDSEFVPLLEAVQSAVRAHTGYGDVSVMKSAGNFGEGRKFDRFGGEVKWTSRTQAALADWDEQGRCVGTMNVVLRGGTGIGTLPVSKAFSLLSCLADLGFDKCRRIDTSIDLFDDWDLSLFHIKEMLKEGFWRIPRRQPSSYSWSGALIERLGAPTPGTLYCGPVSSDCRLAIYDKGAEQELERAWLRFETRHSRDAAQGVYDRLLEIARGAYEGDVAWLELDRFVTAAVKRSGDIRDVTGFPDYLNLPKNWMRSPIAKTPEALAPVFQQVAPLDISDFRVKGGFASQVRHLARSGGKTIWKLCIIQTAKGTLPCEAFLALGFSAYGNLTGEDMEEMAKSSGIPSADLEKAELSAMTTYAQMCGVDVELIASHRTEARAEAMAKLGATL